MTIILDSFDPDEGARTLEIEQAPDEMLVQMVLSGSREAAQELKRRRDNG